jgi:hypothetical protein
MLCAGGAREVRTKIAFYYAVVHAYVGDAYWAFLQGFFFPLSLVLHLGVFCLMFSGKKVEQDFFNLSG